MSGKIDVSILTTGLSSAARKRRVEVAQSLKKLIQAKGKVATLNFQKIFQELKESSDLVRELQLFSKSHHSECVSGYNPFSDTSICLPFLLLTCKFYAVC